jgi:hypothetical protein
MIHVTTRRIEIESLPLEFPILLQSDVHILSPSTQIPIIKRELQLARKKGARILINGDLFDAILPGDLKRYAPSGVSVHADNIINLAIEQAVDLYGPYADLIDMVSLGNHEGSALKHSSVNLIELFINRLNEKCGNVSYGGFAGYVVYRFFYGKRSTGCYRIRYHHGSGGAAPVTKGIIDLTRMATWTIDADMIWIGHKHNQLWTPCQVERISAADRVYEKTINAVMTGGYMSQLETTEEGYATKSNMPHQPKGGAFVDLLVKSKPPRETGPYLEVSVDTFKWSA